VYCLFNLLPYFVNASCAWCKDFPLFPICDVEYSQEILASEDELERMFGTRNIILPTQTPTTRPQPTPRPNEEPTGMLLSQPTSKPNKELTLLLTQLPVSTFLPIQSIKSHLECC